MSDENTTTTDTTTTTTETKKPTKMATLVKAHKETGKKPTPAEAKKLLESFKKGLAARDEAEKALAEASKAMYANAEAMVLAFGDKKVAIGDRVFFPASRGEAVFYRELRKQDEESIIRA